MKIRLLRFACLLICFSITLSLAGCGVENAQITWYDFGAKYSSISSGTVAQNKRFSLIWNEDTASVAIYDKENDITYSNIPTDAQDNTTHPAILSAVSLSYIESGTLNSNTANSYTSAVKKNAVSAERIDNGIRVTYYFEDVAISVPVNYILREDSVKVSVDPSEIGEDEQLCYKITLMPFFCSVYNKADKQDNYLFVPSGSGALVYPKETTQGISELITEQVYGDDLLMSDASATKKENVYLPVYGSKNGNNAICAIIESAEETAEITSNVGSEKYGYSAVYASFYIRGTQISTSTFMGNLNTKKVLFCEGKTQDEISIGFYPLSKDDANYCGMAKTYRNYLIKNKGLDEKKEDSLLNVEMIGGVQTQKFIFGVPYQSLSILTDFDSVKNISSELEKISDSGLNVKLRGFGQSGLDIEKIGGNLSYSNKFGSVKSLSNIDSKVKLYFDFDILRFAKSGKGISSFNDAALTAIGGKSAKRYTTIALSETDWTSSIYRLVSRDKLEELGNKAIDKVVKWGVGGISFGTLTSSSYSDYSSADYYAKQGFDTQSEKILSSAKEKSLKTAVSGANAYSAINADHIYDAPICSSNYQVFDESVPFYQLVFKGYTSMSVKPLNFTENYNNTFLKAVETGSGLGYILINEYDTALISARQNVFYAAVYKDNKANITNDAERYQVLFNSVKNVNIKSHRILEDGFYETVFANDVTVYVNYNETDKQVDGLTVKAGDFTVKDGEWH